MLFDEYAIYSDKRRMNLEKLEAQLAEEEGSPGRTYLDTKGILTGGIGHNLIAHPEAGYDRVGVIVESEKRTEWFKQDIQDAIAALDAKLPWWSALDDVRQNCLLDLTFNMGIGGLLTFHNTLALLEQGNYVMAANGFRNSQYARDVGPTRSGRICRMIERGEW
jgi:lysozyme